jgi:hypothetical protein
VPLGRKAFDRSGSADTEAARARAEGLIKGSGKDFFQKPIDACGTLPGTPLHMHNEDSYQLARHPGAIRSNPINKLRQHSFPS